MQKIEVGNLRYSLNTIWECDLNNLMATPKKKPKTLADIFEDNKYNLPEITKNSRAWFEQQVFLLARKRPTPAKIIAGNPNQLKNRIVPGSMYMYMYDPKMKEVLPYYDRFPLVLPFNTAPGGFLGLNLHYLPYNLRVRLMDRLLDYKTNNKWDETTRIKYSWQLIDGVSKFALAKPCVKQYLYDHIRSPLRLISGADWATAMLLPVETFVGATKNQVWNDSRKLAL